MAVNTLRNLAFISVVNKTLKAKCFMHNFHFIDNSNIKKGVSLETRSTLESFR